MKKRYRSALVALGVAALFVSAAACIPSTDKTCPLLASRADTVACINGGTSVLLTGSATWSVANGQIRDNDIALTIPAGKKVVLAENAKLTIHYDNIKHGILPAVLVHGGEFYMSSGSQLTYTKSTGLPAEYDQTEENRHGVMVEVGGRAELWSAQITAGGYAAFAAGGGGNSIFANGSTLVGGEGLASVPDFPISGSTTGATTAVNELNIGSSNMWGLWAGMVIEPNSSGKLTKAVVHDSTLADLDPAASGLRWAGSIGGYPTPYAALAAGSSISGNGTNYPASNLNVLAVMNCPADGQYISGNDFPTSPNPC